jgi:hypothetical protein
MYQQRPGGAGNGGINGPERADIPGMVGQPMVMPARIGNGMPMAGATPGRPMPLGPSGGPAGSYGMPSKSGNGMPFAGGMPVRVGNGMAMPGPAGPPARGLAAMGRRGDTMLAHVNPREAQMLRARGGAGTINPQTGLREFWGGLSGGSGTDSFDPGTLGGGFNRDFDDYDTGSDITVDFDNGGRVNEEESGPGWGSRIGWGIAGTILTGNPMLGVAAARYMPGLVNRFSSWINEDATPEQQRIAEASINRQMQGQQHISRENAQDFLERAMSDAQRQRSLSSGSDRGPLDHTGRTAGNGGSNGGGGGSSGRSSTSGPTLPPGMPNMDQTPARQVIPFSGDPSRMLPTYGRGNTTGERLWFDRFY